jgi:hypothetical protein
VLRRDCYRGVLTWGKNRKRDAWGQMKSSKRPESEWVTVAAPHLRVVSDELWEAAHERMRASRQNYLRATDGMKARFAQQYRDQVRKHTTATMRRKAEAGLVTGGRVFGYDNKCIAKGHTVRVKNDEEAAIVREIYDRAAAGEGTRTIAEALNRMGALSPRAQQGRPNGWSATTVREVLIRPLC